MTGYRLIVAACVCVGALSGCKKEQQIVPSEPSAEMVVATVNGKPLHFGEMSQRADGYLKYAMEVEHLMFASNMLGQAKEFYRQKAIKTFIYKTVMLDEAARLKLTVTDQERQVGVQQLAASLAKRGSNTNAFFSRGPQPPAIMQRDFEDSLLIEKLLNQEVQKKIRVSDQEVEAGAALIAVTNELKYAKLETIRQQILNGASFEDVAKTVSECPSAKKGGDLGEFPRGKMDPDFDDNVFKLKVGELSPVFETQFGYHLAKVVAHNKAQPAKNGVPAVPETVRASHILIRRISDDRTKIATFVYKKQYERGCREMFEALKAKATITCPLFPKMTFADFDK